MYTPVLCRICLSASINKDIRDLKISENDNSKSYVEILIFCLDIHVVENSTLSTKLCGKCYEAILTYHRFKTLALRNDSYLKTIKQSTVKLEQIIKDEAESELQIDDTNTELQIDIEVKVENDYSKSDDDYDLLSSAIKLKEVGTVQSLVNENKQAVQGNSKSDNNDLIITSSKRNDDNYLKTIKQSTVKPEQTIEDEPESEPEIDDTNTELVIDKFEVKDEFDNSKSDDYDLLINSTTLKEVEMEQSPMNENKPSVQGACHKKELKWNMSKTSKKQPTQEDHMVLESCICAEEAPSLSQLSKNSIIDTQDEHRMFEGPNTEETDRNIIKTMNSKDIVTKSHLNFDKMTFDSRDSNISLKAATEHVCNIPSYTTSKPINLKIHTKSHSARRDHIGVKSYTCDICKTNFAEKFKLQNHVRIHTGEKPFSCEICDKTFAFKTTLNMHIRTHTGEKPYACEICHKRFTHSGNLNRHIRTHTGEKPFACETCDKKFTLKCNLNMHIRTHTGEKPYACEICDKFFLVKSHLKIHVSKHTGKKFPCLLAFACGICNKKFVHKGYLNKHMKTHTGEKPFACEICDKKFARMGNLKMHIRTHIGEKLFACEICDKKFLLNGDLSKHIRRHTDKKPYACELCDKKFVDKGDLKKHIRTHTGEKPYACEVCDKKFALQCNLKVHMRIHTGEKPFSCEICDKKFTRKDRLESHIRIHTNEKPYVREICDM